MEKDMKTPLNMAKALADGGRMRVVAALLNHDELCVCQIVEMLQLTTATVSRHMSILQNARLVNSRKTGKWVYYRLDEAFPATLRLWLTEALAGSKTMAADKTVLEKVLSCDPQDVRRHQKERSHSIS